VVLIGTGARRTRRHAWPRALAWAEFLDLVVACAIAPTRSHRLDARPRACVFRGVLHLARPDSLKQTASLLHALNPVV
jgi:hypothetical protein